MKRLIARIYCDSKAYALVSLTLNALVSLIWMRSVEGQLTVFFVCGKELTPRKQYLILKISPCVSSIESTVNFQNQMVLDYGKGL